jgi:hypothetical protein
MKQIQPESTIITHLNVNMAQTEVPMQTMSYPTTLPSQDPQTVSQTQDDTKDVTPAHLPDSPIQHFDDPTGLHLQVDFAWSKFTNIVSEKNGDQLTPIYKQHFRPTKPQLRFENVADSVKFATGTINNFSISAECSVNGENIALKPLKRWKTQYNYLSHTLSKDPQNPAPISWIANSSLKIWDFVCLDANQVAIAKFSVNWWAIKEVGNFYFEKSAAHVSKEMRDEIVVTGLTLLYVMATRMNNPLHLLGSVFAKPGRVDEDAKKDL